MVFRVAAVAGQQANRPSTLTIYQEQLVMGRAARHVNYSRLMETAKITAFSVSVSPLSLAAGAVIAKPMHTARRYKTRWSRCVVSGGVNWLLYGLSTRVQSGHWRPLFDVKTRNETRSYLRRHTLSGTSIPLHDLTRCTDRQHESKFSLSADTAKTAVNALNLS